LQKTIASRLNETKGHSSGFDYLRIGLSVSVILYHTIIICYGPEFEARFWESPLRPLFYFILPAFFALSGFLVAGSLFRNSIPAFLTLRATRIFPALFCEVMISALILGPMLTAFSLGQYFADHKFWVYLLNATGEIHFQLPGAVPGPPFPRQRQSAALDDPFRAYMLHRDHGTCDRWSSEVGRRFWLPCSWRRRLSPAPRDCSPMPAVLFLPPAWYA
jgi:hypothetical protein